MRFRGILSHMNCHNTKECGGPAMHCNRLFRGIIDEWWLPIQIDGTERGYYMGPFDPQPDTPSFFRWSSGTLQAHLFHDCDMDALQETKSYFDLNQAPWYFTQTENPQLGGLFPIGTNRVWHAGVHFKPPDSNAKVYAATSGTIVAARLGSNAAIENDPEYGSQRFLLIRHCVYWQQEDGAAGAQQINYKIDPSHFFTLYMHLTPVANIGGVDNNNPPWFNYWRRRNPDAGASAVFSPGGAGGGGRLARFVRQLSRPADAPFRSDEQGRNHGRSVDRPGPPRAGPDAECHLRHQRAQPLRQNQPGRGPQHARHRARGPRPSQRQELSQKRVGAGGAGGASTGPAGRRLTPGEMEQDQVLHVGGGRRGGLPRPGPAAL